MFGRSKSLVGLDIGSSAVKAIELKAAGKAYKVSAFGSQPVPPDSIVDGAIIDGTAVVDAIRRLFEGLKSPLADRKPGDIDYYIVRENNEGEYSSIGGRSFEGTDLEQAVQVAMFTKKGCDRVMRYAFNLAMTRKRREVASATKSNGISISMPY